MPLGEVDKILRGRSPEKPGVLPNPSFCRSVDVGQAGSSAVVVIYSQPARCPCSLFGKRDHGPCQPSQDSALHLIAGQNSLFLLTHGRGRTEAMPPGEPVAGPISGGRPWARAGSALLGSLGESEKLMCFLRPAETLPSVESKSLFSDPRFATQGKLFPLLQFPYLKKVDYIGASLKGAL